MIKKQKGKQTENHWTGLERTRIPSQLICEHPCKKKKKALKMHFINIKVERYWTRNHWLKLKKIYDRIEAVGWISTLCSGLLSAYHYVPLLGCVIFRFGIQILPSEYLKIVVESPCEGIICQIWTILPVQFNQELMNPLLSTRNTAGPCAKGKRFCTNFDKK